MRSAPRSALRSARGPLLATALLLASALGPGCDEATGPELETGVRALAGTADLTLSDAAAALTQTGPAAWTLDKAGSLSGDTVTWEITAAETATVAGQLLIHGTMAVTNTGSGPATIGNVVVNLQTRQGNRWVALSSDIANATQGDDATEASIHKAASSENKATFSENAASGSLDFTDASDNTLFSLVPQQQIGAGETKTLLFQAAFDNNTLDLAVGTPIRAEVIVTFGNATQNGNSTPDVDINGNGTIDIDEARVRSVPTRLGLTVPPQTDGDATPTLSDTLDDIVTTGDVTFTNPQFDLGATSGTVTATVSGGTDGGTITNCAHLTTPDETVTSGGMPLTTIQGLDLQACSTIDVGGTPPTCTPGAPGCGWETGDMLTGSQLLWGDSGTTLGGLLATTFNARYPNDLVVGIGHTLTFTDAPAVFTYLPATGTSSALTSSAQNPISTSAGNLGGELVALELNMEYSASFGNEVFLGDLYICNFTTAPSINGWTVSQFSTTANQILGGTSTALTAGIAAGVARLINTAFVSGVPSTFALTNLFSGSCPTN